MRRLTIWRLSSERSYFSFMRWASLIGPVPWKPSARVARGLESPLKSTGSIPVAGCSGAEKDRTSGVRTGQIPGLGEQARERWTQALPAALEVLPHRLRL